MVEIFNIIFVGLIIFALLAYLLYYFKHFSDFS